MNILSSVSIMVLCTFSFSLPREYLQFNNPLNCDGTEYFNSVLLRCFPCDKTRHLIPSPDGLSCICNTHSRIISSELVNFPKCELCPEGEVPLEDQTGCIPCPNISAKDNSTFSCKRCLPNQILVERHLNGSISNSHCINCTNGTIPSVDGKFCVPCSFWHTSIGEKSCSCPVKDHLIDGFCIPNSAITDWPSEDNTFTLRYSSGETVISLFLRENLQKAVYLCKLKNLTACQMLSNMCSMVLYDDTYKGSPCRLFQDSKLMPNWKSDAMPSLYYGDGDAQTVLSRKKISVRFSLDKNTENHKLNLTAVRFMPNGKLKKISVVMPNFFTLCGGTFSDEQLALHFGSRYFHSCTLSISELLSYRDTEFVDLYLQYWSQGESVLYGIPVLILNMNGRNYDNKAGDISKWLLVRRFFLFDKISAVGWSPQKKSQTQEAVPEIIRYVKNYNLRVKLQGPDKEGLIYPPLLVIEYGEIAADDFESNKHISVSFTIDYEMDTSFSHAIELIEIAHLIGKQISVDIFLIDWEQPRAKSSVLHPSIKTVSSLSGSSDQPVSVWRTFFIANEWNEIQSQRKSSLLFQLMITLFFLKVIGLENWALANPEVRSDASESMTGSPPCIMFRFSIGVAVYMTVYLFQWLVASLFINQFIKNPVQEFVDLCSMANISIFLLVQEHYGFYIHGRSPHGFADTDMNTMINQLLREEEDMCGRRGLLPGTDQQTFQMTVPVHLRIYYDKVMSTVSSVMQPTKRFMMARGKMNNGSGDRSIQAYHNMNKFLTAFLEHALKDLDYEVRDKLFVESLLDIEFIDGPDKGVLYTDNGHSFDQVLFYGCELTLASFDLMVFSFIEVVFQDFVLAAIITAIVSKLIVLIRRFGGRRNLIKKTLIDERFLI